MEILTDLCNTSATLRLFYTIKIVFYILKVLLPIICILMLTKKVYLAIISKDSQSDLKAIIPYGTKMLSAAFAFFFVPLIVEFAINNLANQDIDFAYCFKEAELQTIKDLEEDEIENITTEREDRLNALDKVYKEKEAEAIAKYNNKANTDTTTANSTTRLNTGKSNKYFAPLQNVSYSIGTLNNTGGCSNSSVYHDVSAKVGTPIYAGADGTVTYYQYTCNNVLYGYGNLATLTLNDGTYIHYAHLSKFPNGIKATYTKSCPKNSDGTQPCPSNKCQTTITRIIAGKKDVKKGDVIGYTGDTGNSTGPHLHTEIHEQGSNYCVTDPFSAFGMR